MPDCVVDLGDSADFNFQARAPFSLAFWVKSTAASGTVVSFRNSKDDGADIDITIEGGRMHAAVRQDRGFFPGKIGGQFAVNDDRWHHAALTREGNTILYFVDGQAQGKASNNGLEGAITSDWRFLGRERYWLNQGRQEFAGVKGHLEGAIHEFCIFQRALSVDEIRVLAGR